MDRDGKQNRLPAIQELVVSHLLRHSDTHRSMGPHGIHPRVVRELAEKLVTLLAITYDQPLLTKEVPGNWKVANVMPIYRRVRRRLQGTMALILVLGMITEQMILSVITWHVQTQALRI